MKFKSAKSLKRTGETDKINKKLLSYKNKKRYF